MTKKKSKLKTKPHTQVVQLGSEVTVTVQKILPIGLAVELANGRHGVIRERELFWGKRRKCELSEHFKLGEPLQAIVVAEEKGYIELSLRLVEDDPWSRVGSRFEVRSVVSGVVSGIEKYGAFIELEAGVTGLLHHTKLPPGVTGRIGDLLWVGDQVKVCIDSIDPDKRRISLSMNAHRLRRWQNHSPGKKYVNASSDHKGIEPATKSSSKFTLQRNYSVVIIEDDKAQQDALAMWLRSQGHVVRTASCENQGYTLIDQYLPDIVFSDVGLPDGDGIRLIKRLIERFPNLNYVLMTDWLKTNQRMDELACLKAQDVQFLVKPLLPEDVADAFDALAVDAPERDNKYLDTEFEGSLTKLLETDGKRVDATTKDLPAVSIIDSVVVSKELRSLLRRLQQQYQAYKVILFCLDSRQRQIRIMAEVGKGSVNHKIEVDLVHSPVRDVAEDKLYIRIDNVKKRERFAQNLVPLISFQSCIGIPVEGQTQNPWAVFFFFQKPNESAQIAPGHDKIISISIRALLEQQELLQRVVEMQQMSILGVMARGFVHEVNHHLSPLTFGIESLMEKCQQISANFQSDPQGAQAVMDNAGTTLGHLNESLASLAKTARSFAEMSLQDQYSIVQIDELVKRSIDLVLDTTDHANIEILYHPPQQMLYTRARATQLQQVVVNVVLNAVQQIRVFRPTFGGAVHVWMELVSKNGHSYIAIHVEDDGPGIHRRQWEQIFELGFSMRQGEGSGMGLYIARNLMEDAKGRISVQSSHVFWGTVISLEIPVTVA